VTGARRGTPSALAAQRLGLTGGIGSLIVAVTSASVMRLSLSHRPGGNSIWGASISGLGRAPSRDSNCSRD
jgi:hypothetical protein